MNIISRNRNKGLLYLTCILVNIAALSSTMIFRVEADPFQEINHLANQEKDINDSLMKEEIGPRSHGMRRDTQTNFTSRVSCIGDDKGFRAAVARASTNRNKPPTIITLCSRVNMSGIDMSRKNIELRCFNPKGKRCVLDGQRSSSILRGSSATLRATKVDFINANAMVNDNIEGAALSFDDNSIITLNQCSFRNNSNYRNGGAISVVKSKMTLVGTKSSPMVFTENFSDNLGSAVSALMGKLVLAGDIRFINHTGFVGLYLVDSDISMNGISFSRNRHTNGALYVAGGNITMEDSHFSNNTANSECCGAGAIDRVKAYFKNVSFIDNTAWKYSGLGVYNSYVTLDSCTFRNNEGTVSAWAIQKRLQSGIIADEIASAAN